MPALARFCPRARHRIAGGSVWHFRAVLKRTCVSYGSDAGPSPKVTKESWPDHAHQKVKASALPTTILITFAMVAIIALAMMRFSLKLQIFLFPEFLEVFAVALNYPQKPVGLDNLLAFSLELLLIDQALLRPGLVELR